MHAVLRGCRFPSSFILGSLIACLHGCTQDVRGYIETTEQLVPLTGVVTVDGKPASNAKVVFHRPDEPGAGQSVAGAKPNPRGECDEQGRFQIYTYAAYDGAPAGDYRVTVSWRDPKAENREDEKYPELLPRSYQDPARSKLKAEVKNGATEEVKWDLKGKSRSLAATPR